MRINRVRGIARIAANLPSPVVTRLEKVREGLRQHSAVILEDTELDREVIRRLQTQFGESNVTVEKSNKLKVSVDGFNRVQED